MCHWINPCRINLPIQDLMKSLYNCIHICRDHKQTPRQALFSLQAKIFQIFLVQPRPDIEVGKIDRKFVGLLLMNFSNCASQAENFPVNEFLSVFVVNLVPKFTTMPIAHSLARKITTNLWTSVACLLQVNRLPIYWTIVYYSGQNKCNTN